MRKGILIAFILFLLTFVLNTKDNSPMPKKCAALVDKGIAYINKNGLEKAYTEFDDPKGQFIDGELYLFVFDKDGLCLAHGGNKGLIGKNHMELRDVDGVFFVKELIKIAVTKGSGWFDYKWTNPETKKVQKKATFIKKIPGHDGIFLFCGFYK